MTPLKQIITNEQQFQMQPHEIIWRNESNSEQLFFVSCYSDFDRLGKLKVLLLYVVVII